MDEERRYRDVTSRPNIYSHVPGATLLAAILASLLVGGPWGPVFFLTGLMNSTPLFGLVGMMVILSPVALPVFLGLALYVLHRLRMSSCSRVWAYVNLTALCAGMMAPCPLAMCDVRVLRPFDMHLSGFRTYASIKTDVPAIQAWLATLDPNSCQDQRVGEQYAPNQPGAPPFIPWPACLEGFRHANSTLFRNAAGRPVVRFLMGGGGLVGHWGITVGDPNMGMEVPKEPASGSPERRVSLAPGAYVWLQE
jgi:hypothetical protein